MYETAWNAHSHNINIKQKFSNALRAKKCSLSRCRKRRSAGFGASQNGNLPRTENQEPSSHVAVFYCFSHVLDTDECHFQPNPFGRTSPQDHCAWRPCSLSIASWSSSMRSCTSVMVSLTSMAEARAWLNESMDQL